ncbi:hypothetical protein GDO86_019010 [Hymenochirus boettgeri]|uniref:Major facilitator superfamily associated domain-containing protein n=1 Tax=Hymenochirus boettgeri TaxID=247094 RepID=A0A8T2IG70_9PIPI|nr:hypothetical protein GDO86_019010 [Hymenochirus boettgeri]
MGSNKQWDVSKALALASLFHFFHGVGRFCLVPFLPIYFRQLGLSAPLVGIIIGCRHFIQIFWAPLCSLLAKTHRQRRSLISGSLLLSACAGGIFIFYPQLDKDMVSMFCNATMPWKTRLNTPADLSGSLDGNMNRSSKMPEDLLTTTIPPTYPQSGGKSSIHIPAHLEISSPRPSLFPSSAPSKLHGTLDRQTAHEKAHRVTSSKWVPFTHPGNNGRRSTREASLNVSHKAPSHARKHREMGTDSTHQSYFLGEHKVFLFVLGLVIVWEIIAAPLEWTADDSLYEYLDFVDATDRHGKLWIWGYLGASLGSIFIGLLVDSLSCFVVYGIPRISFHFYCYSGFMIASMFLSFLYPVHVAKKSEHSNKTLKTLGLIGNDGRVVLMAVTLFLMGLIGSAAHNFLFWQMQDVGSSELYMGLSVAVALLSELTLYFFKNKLAKALLFKWMVALGLLCMTGQYLYYSFLWTSWAVLPIQLFSAFSNGGIWWALKCQIKDVASPGTERCLLMALRCIAHSSGASIGSFASGFVVDRFNISLLFQACCVSLLLWIFVFLLVQPKLPHIRKINYSRLLAADNSDMSDSDEEQERDWLVRAMEDENANRKW